MAIGNSNHLIIRGREIMDESLLTPYYEKIANQLNDIIPGDWNEIALYAEELGDTRSAIFYFNQSAGADFIHCGKIPDIYGVDRKIYFNLMKAISITVKELRDEYINQEMQAWSALTFLLNRNFRFRTEFQYEIIKEVGSYERGIYWAYEKLKVIPKDDFE